MKKDFKVALEKIELFLDDPESKILLLKGHDEDAKIRASLIGVESRFSNCILLVGTMSQASPLVNRAFDGKEILPENVSSTKSYKIGKLNTDVYSYATSSKNMFRGDNDSCTLVFPVHSVLRNEKKYKKFTEELMEINSRKIILISFNDHAIHNWEIEELADAVFDYTVENDNPELLEIMKGNGVI